MSCSRGAIDRDVCFGCVRYASDGRTTDGTIRRRCRLEGVEKKSVSREGSADRSCLVPKGTRMECDSRSAKCRGSFPAELKKQIKSDLGFARSS